MNVLPPNAHIFFLCDKSNEECRYNHLRRQISQVKMPTDKYEFFTHIWGNQITQTIRDKYCKSDFAMQMHNRNMKTKPLTNGEISLFFNHIECLRKIRSEYTDGLFFIFESDVIFQNNFSENINNICTELNGIGEWDVINVGEGTREYLKRFGHPKSLPIKKNTFTFYNENIHSCAEGLLWNYNSICKFLSYFELTEDIDGPIDTKMDVYCEIGDFKIIWAYPTLVYQGSISGLYNSSLR